MVDTPSNRCVTRAFRITLASFAGAIPAGGALEERLRAVIEHAITRVWAGLLSARR
jgi:hypothetical protein